MEKIKVLAVQMESAIGDKYKNFEKVSDLIEKNITPDIDVVILPELWTVGWACEEFPKSSEVLEGEIVKFLSDIAIKHKVNILGGSFVQEKEGKLFNTCPVLNRKGELVAT